MTASNAELAPLTEQFEQVFTRAMDETGTQPGTHAFYLEVLIRTARMKVSTIQVAAQAYGARRTPSSRSGAVKGLVTQWASSARERKQ